MTDPFLADHIWPLHRGSSRTRQLVELEVVRRRRTGPAFMRPARFSDALVSVFQLLPWPGTPSVLAIPAAAAIPAPVAVGCSTTAQRSHEPF